MFVFGNPFGKPSKAILVTMTALKLCPGPVASPDYTLDADAIEDDVSALFRGIEPKSVRTGELEPEVLFSNTSHECSKPAGRIRRGSAAKMVDHDRTRYVGESWSDCAPLIVFSLDLKKQSKFGESLAEMPVRCRSQVWRPPADKVQPNADDSLRCQVRDFCGRDVRIYHGDGPKAVTILRDGPQQIAVIGPEEAGLDENSFSHVMPRHRFDKASGRGLVVGLISAGRSKFQRPAEDMDVAVHPLARSAIFRDCQRDPLAKSYRVI